MGIVIRNSEGEFIAAAIKPTKCFDYAEVEGNHVEARSRAENEGFLPSLLRLVHRK